MPSALEQLRDIHVPAAVSWWPPAPGYWIVALLVMAALVMALIRYRRAAIYRTIRQEFESLVKAYEQHRDAGQLARQVSILLRRVALTLGSRQEVASVTGKAWITALEQFVAHRKIEFSEAVAGVLTQDIYRAQTPDVELLIEECRRWVSALASRKASA